MGPMPRSHIRSCTTRPFPSGGVVVVHVRGEGVRVMPDRGLTEQPHDVVIHPRRDDHHLGHFLPFVVPPGRGGDDHVLGDNETRCPTPRLGFAVHFGPDGFVEVGACHDPALPSTRGEGGSAGRTARWGHGWECSPDHGPFWGWCAS